MSHWLLYWKDYWIEVEHGTPRDLLRDGWYTAQGLFFNKVEPGDSLWIITNGDSARSQEWRLAHRVVVRAKQKPKWEFDRPYHVVFDLQKSEIFNMIGQPDLTPVLTRLKFATGQRIKARGRMIGRSIQTNRALTDADGRVLESYSKQIVGLRKRRHLAAKA